ncbi:hypothetical protein Zmor_002498 [Zophobas morio]|uniref:Uncharacterized protein n=1 Tax=Zophobas morio TaxID=2755281 RepID=A0AA38J883_9CUCU|nr:hypothetical protein Zmor_002498 [Zophobas morio]
MKCGQTWDEDKPLPVLYGPAESRCNGEHAANVHLIEGAEEHGRPKRCNARGRIMSLLRQDVVSVRQYVMPNSMPTPAMPITQ